MKASEAGAQAITSPMSVPSQANEPAKQKAVPATNAPKRPMPSSSTNQYMVRPAMAMSAKATRSTLAPPRCKPYTMSEKG